MAEDNVELFNQVVDAYNRRDVEALLEVAHPNVEWHPAGVRALTGDDAGVYRGHDGMRQMFREVDEEFSAVEVELSEVRDLGERFLAIGRFHVRGRESEAEVTSPLGAVADFADGKVLRVQTYLDHAEALEAVGLSE